VAISNFPDDSFVIEGDPEAIADSSRAYGRCATIAAEAGAGLRGVDSGSWQGAAGDRFRARLADLPPRLDTAYLAFAQVARALATFATELAEAQRQMAAVRADAEQTFESLRAAVRERAALQQPSAGAVAAAEAGAGVEETAADAVTRDLDGRVGGLSTVFDGHLEAAASVRAQVQEAARQAANQIRAAERVTTPGS
jgi:uncharacterized protein YukE